MSDDANEKLAEARRQLAEVSAEAASLRANLDAAQDDVRRLRREVERANWIGGLVPKPAPAPDPPPCPDCGAPEAVLPPEGCCAKCGTPLWKKPAPAPKPGESELDEALDALEDMCYQHCSAPDGSVPDKLVSPALGSDASALRLLAKHGRVRIESEYGRVVVVSVVVVRLIPQSERKAV